jgi:hydrogenase maturation protease
VSRIRGDELPAGVDVADYGIRGVHLAYELLEGRHRCLVLVDAVPMGEPPGTLAVLEVDGTGPAAAGLDAHSMSPDSVLAALAALGGSVPRVLVVGCQPAALDTGMTLSEPVAGALEAAVKLVVEVASREAAPATVGEVR